MVSNAMDKISKDATPSSNSTLDTVAEHRNICEGSSKEDLPPSVISPVSEINMKSRVLEKSAPDCNMPGANMHHKKPRKLLLKHKKQRFYRIGSKNSNN